MFRADVGFGAHDLFSDPQSEYTSGHSAVRIELIDTRERVDALLPTLYEMVTDGLIIEQDATVIKSVSSDVKQKAAMAGPKRIVHGPAKMVRIYLGESDQWNGEPLFEAIVKKLRMMDFSGATVYRGILGYGAKGQTHEGGLFGFSHDLPIMISVVETPEKLSDLVRVVSEMMQDGIIVTSDVELHRIEHEVPHEEAQVKLLLNQPNCCAFT
jgi:PII-like signaling protein